MYFANNHYCYCLADENNTGRVEDMADIVLSTRWQ